MAPSRTPFIREIAWISVIPQLAIGAALIGLSFLVFREPSMGLIFGASVYLIWSRLSKLIWARHQIRGVKLLVSERFEAAIAEFEASYAFFSRHKWLDRFRYITLLSSSAYSYRELALCNIAFANMRLQRVPEAIDAYRRALAEFPKCTMAGLTLQGIHAVQTYNLPSQNNPPTRS